MAHVPSLPPELVRIIARFTEPGAWSTARALSKVWREAIHERTKDPAALDELLLHMHNRGRELRHDDVHWLDTRAAVEKWISEEPYLPEADEEMEEHFEAQLFSTFRWVMLRMVDRVRFGSFYVERLDPTHPGRPMTQLQPLIWEMK